MIKIGQSKLITEKIWTGWTERKRGKRPGEGDRGRKEGENEKEEGERERREGKRARERARERDGGSERARE